MSHYNLENAQRELIKTGSYLARDMDEDTPQHERWRESVMRLIQSHKLCLELAKDQAETIAAQQQVLDQIAAALGVETGDVEGIGQEIEGLKEALKQIVEAEVYTSPTATDFGISECRGRLVWNMKDIARKALAGGEAV